MHIKVYWLNDAFLTSSLIIFPVTKLQNSHHKKQIQITVFSAKIMTIFLLSPDISEQQHSNEKKKVAFSDQARMSYYDELSSYRSNIAYTFDEIKYFQANTTLHMFRLRHLVKTGIYPSAASLRWVFWAVHNFFNCLHRNHYIISHRSTDSFQSRQINNRNQKPICTNSIKVFVMGLHTT